MEQLSFNFPTSKVYLSTQFDDLLISNEDENLIKTLVPSLFPNNWIQTYSGEKFNPISPLPATIKIEDIAHALSNICRFTGHSKSFYSVALHSVLVSYVCDKSSQKHALLHDASEAYLSDIASPIKKTNDFSTYRNIEENLQKAIYNKFGLVDPEPCDVKDADLVLLATEARDLFLNVRPDWNLEKQPLPFKINPLPPEESKKLFLQRFHELFGTNNE